MKIKETLIHVGELLFLLEVLVQATLAGGAFYAAETGKHLQGFWFEEFPSAGAGILSPICAAVISLVVLPSWFQLPKYLRRLLVLMLTYWFLNWVPFIATYYLAHPESVPFTEVYKVYFPNQWRLVAVLASLSLVSANVIMFPGLLTAIYARTFLTEQESQQSKELESEQSKRDQAKQQVELLKDAGLWAQRIVKYFESEIPVTDGRTLIQICNSLPGEPDRSKIYPHVRKLEEMGYLYSTQGEGREKVYFRNIKV